MLKSGSEEGPAILAVTVTVDVVEAVMDEDGTSCGGGCERSCIDGGGMFALKCGGGLEKS